MMERKHKILVVDNDLLIIRAIRSALLQGGYDVISANDGIECLEKVRNESPDLIILDVLMPRKGGWAVVEELKAKPETSHLPILMLTGVDGLDSMNTGIELGVDCYLTKPFQAVELLAMVEHLLSVSG